MAGVESVNDIRSRPSEWLTGRNRRMFGWMTPSTDTTSTMQSAVLIALGALWSVLLVVGGALVATRSSSALPTLSPVLACGGITAMIAGQFVFLVVVADRIFPNVQRRIALVSEAILAAALVAGLAATITLLRTGGSGA